MMRLDTLIRKLEECKKSVGGKSNVEFLISIPAKYRTCPHLHTHDNGSPCEKRLATLVIPMIGDITFHNKGRGTLHLEFESAGQDVLDAISDNAEDFGLCIIDPM